MAIGRLLVGKGGSMRTPVIQIKGDGNTHVIELIVQRYYGGIDLAPLTWSVTAENANGAPDEYDVSNMQIKDDVITMLWTLYGTVTAAAGIARFKLTGYSNADDKVLVWHSGTYCIGVSDTIEYEPGSEVGQELSNVHKLIAYVDQELNGVVQAGKDAAEAAERANVAADRVDSRVTALEKFTLDPEPYTLTGDVVQLDNYENMPMNVVTHIEPVQPGSGDPSPDNIRPITGHVGDVLIRCGKNLLPTNATTKTTNGVKFTVNGDGSISAKGTATGGNAIFEIGTDLYTLVGAGQTVTVSGCPNVEGCGFHCYYKDSNGVAVFNTGIAYGLTKTVVIGKATLKPYISIKLGSTVDTVFYPQMELGTAATEYEPYNGETYTADFGQTVYGGTLDWNTGVLTVEWGMIASYASETLSGEWMSDRDVYISGATPTTGAQVCYKLTTPTTIQLTPQDILALGGVNTLYAEAGDITVSGRKDILYLTGYLLNKLKSIESVN